MSNFAKLHLTHEIFRILTMFSQFLLNLTIICQANHFQALEKCKKTAMFFKLFWYTVQGFCPLKIKIAQFPGGFHLKILLNYSETSPQWLPVVGSLQFNLK